MEFEYIEYLELPFEPEQNQKGFAKYIHEKIVNPLLEAGYELTHLDFFVWNFRKQGIMLSLEYSHSHGDFSLMVDRWENAQVVFQDFIRHTPLISPL